MKFPPHHILYIHLFTHRISYNNSVRMHAKDSLWDTIALYIFWNGISLKNLRISWVITTHTLRKPWSDMGGPEMGLIFLRPWQRSLITMNNIRITSHGSGLWHLILWLTAASEAQTWGSLHLVAAGLLPQHWPAQAPLPCLSPLESVAQSFASLILLQ